MNSIQSGKKYWLMVVLARRLVHASLLMMAVFTLSFSLAEFAPGDYYDSLRLDPAVSDEAVEAMRHRHGQDRSTIARYFGWLEAAFQGDFGTSLSHRQPVLQLLLPRVRNTLLLSTPAMCIAWIIAIVLGSTVAALNLRSVKLAFGGSTSMLLAIPDLLLALGFMVLALRTGWFPTGGMVSFNFVDLGIWAKCRDFLNHLVVPLSALVLSLLPLLLRHVHDSMVEVLHSPLIRATRAYGMRRVRLVLRHALPVAANPLITLLGLSIGTLLSVSLLIEVVVGWPGVGPLLLEAILARDIDLVLGSIVVSTLLLVLGNFTADILLVIADPRLRGDQ